MQVNTLDHINVITDRIDETAAFYTAVLGLERRDGPPPFSPQLVQWMLGEGGRVLVHINHPDCPRAFDRKVCRGEPTGAIHHIAFACTGFDELIARLQSMGLDHQVNTIESIGLKQIFVSDPNQVLLELNFYGD